MTIDIQLEARFSAKIEGHIEDTCFKHAVNRALQGQDVALNIVDGAQDYARCCFDCAPPDERWWRLGEKET